MSDTESETEAISAIETHLDKLGLEQYHKGDFKQRFVTLLDEAREVAECDHERAALSADPQEMARSLEYHLDAGAEGTQKTFRATCRDCGADLSADLKLEFNR